MLSLWRERWGKAEDSVRTLPYLEGRLNQWSARLMAARIWSLPGFPALTVLVCVLGLALVVSVQLSFNSQIVFSTVLVCTSLFIRRYAGHWVTLVLVGLSLTVSARYFFWRMDATLGHYLDLLFVLGFCLLAAELHIWMLHILNGLADAFPLKRGSVPLPDDPNRWATVDVFILCDGQPATVIERAARAAFTLVWPKEKIKIYLLDDQWVDSTQRLASAMGFSYVVGDERPIGKIDCLNHALSVSQGEWLLIFTADHSPDKNILTHVGGWWCADKKLGFLQTPFHFLAPEPSRQSLSIMGKNDLNGSFAAIRRAMLVQAGGFSREPVTEQAHTARSIQAMGFTCAYMGCSVYSSQDPNSYILPMEQDDHAQEDYFRVDRPFSHQSLRWRQYVGDARTMLQFYRNASILIFFLAPLAYLLKDLNLIQTSPDLIIAYGLPHLLHAYWAQSRLEEKPRLGILTELKETAMGVYMLMSTAFAVVRAEFNLRIRSGFKKITEKHQAFDPLIALPYVVVLVLNLVGLLSGVIQLILPDGRADGHGLTEFYLVWAGYNLLLLTGMLAIAEETRHIYHQAKLNSRLQATVVLTSGHAITCTTVNFPNSKLMLDLSAPVAVPVGTTLNISIFRLYREFVFPAHVAYSQEIQLIINIDDLVREQYQAFGAAVFSRGPDWPKWLPGRNADRPFPPWAIKAFNAAREFLLNMKMRMGGFAWLTGFGSLLQIWKRK